MEKIRKRSSPRPWPIHRYIEGLNFSTQSHKPEDFFNELFDEFMYTIMAQQTNEYAHDKIREVLQVRDQFEQMDHYREVMTP